MVGYRELTFRLRYAFNLKEKRSIRQSMIRKIQNRYHVSVAEVGANDIHNILVLGIAVVSNSETHTESVLDEIEEMILSNYDVDLIQTEMEWK